MSHQNENVITGELVRILRGMCYSWKIEAQQRPFLDSQTEPDIFMTKKGHEPVAIEAKYASIHEKIVREQTAGHIGRELEADYIETKKHQHTVMAIRYPNWFKDTAGANIERKLRETDELLYLLIGRSSGERYQFPKKGWAKGTVADIANALHVGAVPSERIDAAAREMERNINIAAQLLDKASEGRPGIANAIEGILHQGAGEQTYRMAMLIITDAFVFQSSLAGKPELETVHSLSNHLRDMDYVAVVRDWEKILKVNYRPIFEDALRLVEALSVDDRLVHQVLRILCEAANDLVQTGLAQIHELAGTVFQKLIVDRKYIKANYTLPTSATLLSALVLPSPPVGEVSNSASGQFAHLPKIADFACGTGALLNGVYQRLQHLYEQQGDKNSADIHRQMLEENIGGSDVMPNATHITTAVLASAQPDIKIGSTRVVTAAYGKQPNGSYAVGSLELIDNELLLPTMDNEAVQLGGEEHTTVAINRAFKHGEFDIVIQNPPFTKPNADSNNEVPKGVFEGSERPEEDAKEMRQALREKNTRVTHGMAGLGCYFVDLADKMLAPDGTLGFILPVTVLASPHWQKVRDMFATEYRDVIVITISQAKGEDSAFSADTGIAECMIVATKGKGKTTGRGKFVSLNYRPSSSLEATVIADIIQKNEGTRRFEDSLSGCDLLNIGESTVGQILNCPLPEKAEWVASRVKAMELLQCGRLLAEGTLWLPTCTSGKPIPICRVEEIATPGMSHLAVYGEGEQGVFDMAMGYSETDRYPCLWKVNSPIQRAIVAAPDAHGILRSNTTAKLQKLLARNSRAHYNQDLRFNANSVAALFTEKPALGVSSIKNVAFQNPRYEIPWTLWCNSTLGLLCHWFHSSKQQVGRGRLSLMTLRTLPTLDVRQLTDAQLSASEAVFEALKFERMLPFNECWDDAVRKRLDEMLLTEVLGITDASILTAMQTLRELLSAEPSIDGGKQSRCALLKELKAATAKGIVLPGMTAASQSALIIAQEQSVLELAP